MQIFLGCLLDNYNFDGVDNEQTTSVDVRDATGCQLACFNKEECNYWGFEKTSKKCYLYRAHSSSKIVGAANYVIGPKKCFNSKDAVKENDNASCKPKNVMDWCPISLGKFIYQIQYHRYVSFNLKHYSISQNQ